MRWTGLDAGEEDALALAVELRADLLLMDDREGVIVARRKGFRVAGSLTILATTAQHRLLNLADAVDRIKRTNFHYRQELMDQFLKEISGQACGQTTGWEWPAKLTSIQATPPS